MKLPLTILKYLFGETIGNLNELSDEEILVRCINGVAQLQKKYTNLPTAPLTAELVNEMRTKTTAKFSASTIDLYSMLKDKVPELPSMHLFSHIHFTNYGGMSNLTEYIMNLLVYLGMVTIFHAFV